MQNIEYEYGKTDDNVEALRDQVDISMRMFITKYEEIEDVIDSISLEENTIKTMHTTKSSMDKLEKV